MIEPIRIVLAGIGGYGINYVTSLLQLLQQDATIHLAGLIDPTARRSPVYPMVSHLPIYPDLESFYRERSADLAILASPIPYHAEQILTALVHGSHVLCEKPLCATREQGLALIRAQEQSGLQVGIGYQWSYSPVNLRARADVQAGLYGRPLTLRTCVAWPRSLAYFGRSNWAGKLHLADGQPVFDSVLNNATAHYLHNMLFFLGRGVHDAVKPDRISARLLRIQPIESFDTAFVRMECDWPGGAPVILLMASSHSTVRQAGPDLDYQFERGSLTVRDGRISGVLTQDGNTRTLDYGLILRDDSVIDKIQALLAVVRSGQRPVCDVRTALAQTDVIARLHETVPIEDVPTELIRRDRHDEADWLMADGLDEALERFVATGTVPSEPLTELLASRSGLL
jgi:predicted dehydrogenase